MTDLEKQLSVLAVRARIEGWHPSWTRVYADWVHCEGHWKADKPSENSKLEELIRIRLEVYDREIADWSGDPDSKSRPSSQFDGDYKRYD